VFLAPLVHRPINELSSKSVRSHDSLVDSVVLRMGIFIPGLPRSQLKAKKPRHYACFLSWPGCVRGSPRVDGWMDGWMAFVISSAQIEGGGGTQTDECSRQSV
jgi:hypothetical protein